VLALVRRQALAAEGRSWTADDEEAFRQPTRKIYQDFQQIGNFAANLWVDDLLDPPETRDALGLLLDLASRTPARPTAFGVFRF